MTQVDRPQRSERKARGLGHLRRAELLAAAERIFKEAGYEGATIRRIAEEVGVSSTALYMYFQDKSQIMLEICVQALEGQFQDLEALSRQPMEPVRKVRLMLEHMLAFGFQQPTAYQLLYCVAPRDVSERRNAVLAPLSQACFTLVQETVQAAMDAGQMKSEATSGQVTDALICACHGSLCLRIANPDAPWGDPAVLTKVLLDGLLYGFGAE